MCHHLTFGDGDESSIDSNPPYSRTEQSPPAEHQMAHHLTSAKEEVEHFPTASLDNDVWMEEPEPIQLGPATPLSRICTNTTVHGSQ